MGIQAQTSLLSLAMLWNKLCILNHAKMLLFGTGLTSEHTWLVQQLRSLLPLTLDTALSTRRRMDSKRRGAEEKKTQMDLTGSSHKNHKCHITFQKNSPSAFKWFCNLSLYTNKFRKLNLSNFNSVNFKTWLGKKNTEYWLSKGKSIQISNLWVYIWP